ncbi:hypothetical protein GE09DRAFT_1182734 [Coniochaeta sp. 2T2.1]|nr:hypothetical protein GE09DRAFT_1182734 [Coniochaeta sp. 2T2.1]
MASEQDATTIQFTEIPSLFKLINNEADKGRDSLTFTNISSDAFTTIEKEREEQRPKFSFRRYDSESQVLTITIPTPLHERLYVKLCSSYRDQLADHGHDDYWDFPREHPDEPYGPAALASDNCHASTADMVECTEPEGAGVGSERGEQRLYEQAVRSHDADRVVDRLANKNKLVVGAEGKQVLTETCSFRDVLNEIKAFSSKFGQTIDEGFVPGVRLHSSYKQGKKKVDNDLVFDSAVSLTFPKQQVKLAHIIPYKIGPYLMQAYFGHESGDFMSDDLMTPQNGLLLYTTVEKDVNLCQARRLISTSIIAIGITAPDR